ncbi:MAG: EamA family transporter [Oscillospiraceae bacterium]|nr:EamA family transporter [Oscillospiraceae bacterium]MBP1556311.1 EamA family transporter [Oscillospiraceae bacterium]
MTKKAGTIAVILSAALWGTISIFVKMLSALGLSTVQSIALRSIPAVIFLAIFLFVKDKSLLFIAPKDWYYFFGTGIFSLLFFNCCYFYSIEASSVAVAAVLLYTAPIFVTLMSAVLFKEKLTAKKLVALLLTFIGCVLVSNLIGSGQKISTTALLAGIGSGFGYALYSIFGRYALQKYKPFTVTLWTIIFAGAGSVIAMLLQSGFYIPAGLFTAKGIIGVLGLSILCCALPYMLYTSGLAVIESSKASIIATVEPAVAAIIGVCVFSERLSVLNLIGMAMIFGSVLLLANKE